MLRDIRLGATERGLLLTVLSLPDNWNFSIKGLTCILPDGYTKIATALKNIEKTGYLVRRRIYTDGKISDWEYLFSDEPMSDVGTVENTDDAAPLEPENLELENLILGNLKQEKLELENPCDNKRNNNQISKDQISTNQASIHQSDGLTDREQYSELMKANIGYAEYAEWIRLFAGDYMTVQELDEIVAMICISFWKHIRRVLSNNINSRNRSVRFLLFCMIVDAAIDTMCEQKQRFTVNAQGGCRFCALQRQTPQHKLQSVSPL